MTATDIIRNRVQMLEKRYNPENDTIPGAPSVTHTDYVLLDAILHLCSEVDKLIVQQPAQLPDGLYAFTRGQLRDVLKSVIQNYKEGQAADEMAPINGAVNRLLDDLDNEQGLAEEDPEFISTKQIILASPQNGGPA